MSLKTHCLVCGHALETRKETRRYGRGIDVVLAGVEVRHCGDCGEEYVVIPNVENLHKIIAGSLANKRGRLKPGEIRFLRTFLGYSSQDFAGLMGVRPETVTRWEHPREGGMSSAAERFLRLAVMIERPIEDYGLENIGTETEDEAAPPRFYAEGGSWAPEIQAC